MRGKGWALLLVGLLIPSAVAEVTTVQGDLLYEARLMPDSDFQVRAIAPGAHNGTLKPPPIPPDIPSLQMYEDEQGCWAGGEPRHSTLRNGSDWDGSLFFRFAESEEENGCMQATWRITTPAGAGWDAEDLTAWINFYANRDVQTTPNDMTPSFRQQVIVARDDDTAIQTPLRSDPYFADSYGVVDPAARISPDPFVVQSGTTYQVVWQFLDMPSAREDSPGDVDVRVRQSTESTIRNATFTFRVASIEVAFNDLINARSPDGALLGYAQADLTVPVPDGYTPEARFSVSNEFGIHAVQYRGPDGEYHKLDNTAFGTREDAGQLQLILGGKSFPEDLQGDVTFRVLYTVPDSRVVQNSQAIVMMPFIFLPVVALLIAQRAVSRYSRRVGHEQPFRSRTLQATVIGGWTLYAGGVLGILVTGTVLLMVSWPLAPQAILMYAILVLVSIVSIVVAVLARQFEISWAQHELTERERIQKELERSNQELEQFAYVASHDLKEPLRMVAGYTQLLGRRYQDKLDDAGKQFIHYASDGAERMQRMVDDLLRYSRVRSDRTLVAPVHLAETMFVVRSNLQEAIKDSGARLEYGELPWVLADRTQMSQLMQNLIHNAIKFNRSETPKVKVAAERKGPHWVISVKDNGIGIPEKDQDRVFQIFQRLHKRDEYAGSGIGLALCKKIVEQNDGEMWLRSEPDKGTTFYFRLPAAEPPRPGGDPTTAPTRSGVPT